MNRFGWICLIVLGVASCTDKPCGLDDLVSCSDCGVRHAFVTGVTGESSDTVVASRGPVTACATCGSVWSLDTQTAVAKIDIGPRTEILQISGAADGTLYVIADQAPAPSQDDIDTPMATNRTLLALDPTDAIKFSFPVDDYTTVLAGPDGPFVLAGPNGVRGITAFDTEHVQRWTMSFLTGATVGPDGKGGLWVSTGAFSNQNTSAIGQIRHLDATGADVGAPAEVGVNPSAGDDQTMLNFAAFSPTADGGFVTGGWVEGGSIVFESTKVDPPAMTTVDEHGFVAAYDANAKLLWAHIVDSPGGDNSLADVAATADGLVVITGFSGASGIAGISDAEDTDVLVETWNAGGMTAAVQIGGAGEQLGRPGLAVDADGSVWASFQNLPAQLTTSSGDPVNGSTELTLDGDSFDGGSQRYVIDIQF